MGTQEHYDIIVDKLTRTFGTFTAVDGISFRVRKGELFGLLGPNGAGKTTTIKMLTGTLNKTSGGAKVAGFDIDAQVMKVRHNIGIVFQDPSLDDKLTGRENLEFHAILYHMGKEERSRKVDEILKLVELEDKQDVLIENYSGGMKRRLEIGRGLLHNPRVLFLDEPTLGLDVQTRRKIWEYIKRLNNEKHVTIVLTTHYIEEADELCNRIAFVDHGRIVALDTPRALKDKLGGDVVTLELSEPNQKFEAEIKRHKQAKHVAAHNNSVDVTVENGEKQIPLLIELADKRNVEIKSVNLRKPSLEDVFVHYTGKTIREEEGEGKGWMRMYARRGMR